MLFESPKEFIATLQPHARVLGLDVGSTTIGLALSDVMRTIATPLETIDRKKFTKDMETLAAIIKKQGVSGLVIGYPINMDGTHGPRTQSTRAFVSTMSKHIDLPMIFSDERMSTMAVERTMLAADLSRERRSQLVDKLAASYMLQGFLDSVKNS